jgi:hypothetical protein
VSLRADIGIRLLASPEPLVDRPPDVYQQFGREFDQLATFSLLDADRK